MFLAIAGAALSIYGAMKDAQARNAAASSERALLAAQADETIVRGRMESSRAIATYSAQAETAAAGFASQGIDVHSGVGLVVQNQLGDVGRLEAEQIVRNAQLEAWGLRSRGGSIISAANRSGSNQITAAGIGGASQLIAAGIDKYGSSSSLSEGQQAKINDANY